MINFPSILLEPFVLSRAGYTNNVPIHVTRETRGGKCSGRLKERWFILNDDVRRNILIISFAHVA